MVKEENGKVLVSDYVHNQLITRLNKAGYQIDYLPEISYAGFKAVVSNYKGVIINSKIKMTEEVLQCADKLKFIGRLGSGLDIIDLPAAKSHGVSVFAAPEGNCNAVAEHAVGMLLCLLNNLRNAHQSVCDFEWSREENRGNEMEGKTIGILGYGHTGSSFAKKWAGWKVNVLAYDKYKTQYANELDFVTETSLAEVVEKSDVLSLHLPLTEETNQWIDTTFLSKMKKGAILLNTSRGKVVVTKDVFDGLQNGQLSGACLDVLENEKMNNLSEKEKSLYKDLFALENVVLSPHIAGWTHQSLFKIADVLADKIISNKEFD